MQRATRLGMTLFLVSETIFFFMFVLAFVVFRNLTMAMAADMLNFPATSAYTLCLLASGLTVWRAARISSGLEGHNPRPWLAGTAALGLVFLFGQGAEYIRLVRLGVTVSQSLFGTTFFTVTGMHGVHVVLGLLFLTGTLWVTRAGRVERPEMVQTVAAFWLFVAGIWFVIFSVLYLGTFLWRG